MGMLGILIFTIVTLLPGLLLMRLFRNSKLHSLDALLYSVGLGLVFNIIVGFISNFTFGIRLLPVAMVYLILLVIVGLFSWRYGTALPLKWMGWKPIVIPLGIYLFSVALQYQTTVLLPNLVGSDIHLEYFMSNRVLEQGVWNPMYMGTTLNACIGLVLLLPVYKLLTGLSLLLVFKLICPLVFAVLPIALYRIFKMQFGTVVAVLSVVFFITMPMFTMDMVQLVRQQQSELFFVLTFLLVIDNNLRLWQKMVLGIIFSAGVITTHVGIAIGSIGYWVGGGVVVIGFAKLWRNKLQDVMKPILPKLLLVMMVLISLGVYAGWYGWVYGGVLKASGTEITGEILGNTVESARSGIQEAEVTRSFLDRFPFLDPFTKEPLVQTAIGLDFGKASALGKVWRVLQYLVEVCLLVGFFSLLFRPTKTVRIEYISFVIASSFVLVGMYLLMNYGWGLGATRVWQITLLFMSPLFVIGCSTIGRWVTRFKGVNTDRLVVCSTLVLLLPYFIFNSGIVFEVAKLKPVDFIDVPYSISLSVHRVDVAGVFTENDVEAMDWLKEQITEDTVQVIYIDVHSGNLLVQKLGTSLIGYSVKNLWFMEDDDVGYIFLRQWNVENNMLTLYGGYASRQSYSMDDYEVLKDKIENGIVVFDNGAKVILVEE